MDKKKFNLWNMIVAGVVFIISAFTYLSTIEPTASFWDCGEFIASSYKLEVGHPPGNPVFQLIARFFTLFGDNMHAAVLVNSMSALCSALTIFFLFLTIVFLARRLVKANEDGGYSLDQVIVILGSGAVGALAYCFSDTFWFSAVEGEVYAMSSLFTAMVFWAMTKWYEQEDRTTANRWIILISFLMGLSIGVHLLNLLTIPAIVFLYYYKMREGHYTFWEYVKIFLISCVIIFVILYIMVPWLPKIAAYVDLFFVNVLGCHFNVGAAIFMVALIAACFWGLFNTLKTNKVFLNTVLLCTTMIIIGFSIFSIEIIRSCAKTPTNEYQPDNPFTLCRYLGREQYGSTPLLYGQYFDAPYELVEKMYWAPVDGKYKQVPAPAEPKYSSAGKMLFPRMWSSDENAIQFYESYMPGGGTPVEGAEHAKPTFGQNLGYFFGFQLNWMYWRYFMWNFAGRQNEIASQSPGNIIDGNWESGIKPLDNLILGDQSNAPASLINNKGKNHYFLLPLLLGILGLVFQFDKDKRGCWLTFLLFFMTGIAIVIYLNQPPYQVRERDYAYAGSFYAFSIWIGLAVAAIYSWIKDGLHNNKYVVATASVVTVACLFVPALMAEENWDDHDRSNRYTSVEMAKNYLNSVGKNGILVTHGDNDTFPLWYAQEVESFRTDVRICNTSLLGTDWHIDQMKYACNESAPLPLSVGLEQYMYGTNEYVIINDTDNKVVPIADVMAVFRHPLAKITLTSGKQVNFIMSRKISVPVNKANIIKYGILDAKFADQIPDTMVIEIPKDRDYISKPELFFLDLLSNYNWDRPINMLNQGADLNVGIKNYLMYEGYSYKFVPIKINSSVDDPGLCDPEELYRMMKTAYSWNAIKRTDYDVDYQNLYTHVGVMPVRGVFVNFANAFIKSGHNDWALEALDKCQEVMLDQNYPFETIPLGFTTNDYYMVDIIEDYYKLGKPEKARAIAVKFSDELLESARFFLGLNAFGSDDFKASISYSYMLGQVMDKYGDKKLAASILDKLQKMYVSYYGQSALDGADSTSADSSSQDSVAAK